MTTAVHPEGAQEDIVISGDHLMTKLMLKGKATSDKIDKLFSLMNIMLTNARLDSRSRVIELLKEDKSRMESRIRGR